MRPALRQILLSGNTHPLDRFGRAFFVADFERNFIRLAEKKYNYLQSVNGFAFTRALQAYALDAQGRLRSFLSGQMRLTDRGLLTELAATNLLLRSQELDDAAWSKTNVTVTANNVAAPDGTTTADKIEAASSAATSLSQVGAANASTRATFSVYIKKGSGATDANAFKLRNNTTTTDLISITINYDTLAISYVTGSTGAVAQQLADGWIRLTITATSGITSGNTMDCYACFVGGSETAGEYAYVWGVQQETERDATSYIVTTSATVTRPSDSALISGVSIQATRSMYAEGEAIALFNGGGLIGADDGSSSNASGLYFSGAVAQALNRTGGSNDAVVNSGAAINGSLASFKNSGRFETNNVQGCRNGTLGTTDTACTPLAAIRLTVGELSPAGVNKGTYIKRLAIWPFAMTDAQLQAVTA